MRYYWNKKFSHVFLISIITFLLLKSVAQPLQCPGSTTFISIGDSVEKVIECCGPPLRVIEEEASSTPHVEVWQYNTFPAAPTAPGPIFPAYPAYPPFAGVPYTTGNSAILVVLENQMVSSIQATYGQLSAYPCPYGSIAVGIREQELLKACGTPLSKSTKAENTSRPHAAITLLQYKPQSYSPITTLIFHDGLLVKRN